MPIDAGVTLPPKPKSGPSSDEVLAALGPSGPGHPTAEREDPFEQEDLRNERELQRDRPLDLPPAPSRRLRNRGAESASPSPAASTPAPSALAANTPTTSAPPSSAPASSSGSSGGISASSLGGSFPSLPTTATSTGSSTASTSSSRSSAGGSSPVFSPSSSSQAAAPKSARTPIKNEPAASPSSPGEGTTVAAREDDKPADDLVKPMIISETQKMTNETETPNNTSAAWIETMRIPAGLTGLSLTPHTVTVATPAANELAAQNNEAPGAPTPILGATFKSNFDISEKPTVQILIDCGDPAQNPNCDPTKLPSGAPVLADYFYQGAAHQDDLVPSTPDSFEIGTVVVGTEKDASGKEISLAEVAFHLLPGSTPGKYQVALIGKGIKHLASFEVVAASAPPVKPASRAAAGKP